MPPNSINVKAGITGFAKYIDPNDPAFTTGAANLEARDRFDMDEDRGKVVETKSHYVVLVPDIRGGVLKVGRTRTMVNGRNMNEVYKLMENSPLRSDSFYVMIGVIDGEKEHVGVFGNTISYDFLFDCLIEKRYDPLWPIRRVETPFVKSIEKRMGKAVLDNIGRSRSNPTRAVKSALGLVARDVVDFVRDYIAGGDKPPLEASTIYNRRYRQKHGLAKYPNGIDMPLSETGRLEMAIGYKVLSFRSQKRLAWDERRREAREAEKRRRALRKRQTRAAQIDEQKPKKERFEAYEATSEKAKQAMDEYRILSANKTFREFVEGNWNGKPFDEIDIGARHGSVGLFAAMRKNDYARIVAAALRKGRAG